MTSRIILITGANSGVGYAATQVLAGHANNHIIMASRSLEKVEKALNEIKSEGVKGTLSALQLDVTDQTSIRAAAKQVSDAHGHLDVLVNNAATGNLEPDAKTRFEASFTTNVIGPALVCEAFRPLLLKSSNPYSIFVTSGAGSLTRAFGRAPVFPHDDAYSASKAALNMIAVKEHKWYGDKIKVFTYCPGFVVSNIRGTDEESRMGQGKWAGLGAPAPAKISGEGIEKLISGARDGEAGLFVNNAGGVDGVYPW